MIFSASDLAIYAPEVSITESELLGKIALIQAAIEGESGANHSIELQQFTEYFSGGYGYVRIPYKPFVYHETDYPIAVRGCSRTRSSDLFGRSCGNRYVEIDASAIEVIPRDGQIIVPSYFSEIEVVFWSGIDFSQDTPEVRKLKAAIGQMLNFAVNVISINPGVASYDLYQDRKEVYSRDTQKGKFPIELLVPFHAYRPLSFGFS